MITRITTSGNIQKELRKTRYLRFIVLILLVWYVTISVLQQVTFDLYRYYEMAELNVISKDLMGVIESSREHNVDFLYHTILYVALIFNIPLNLVTVTIVSLYYFLILSCIRDIWNKKIAESLLFVILFTTPICWVVSISRNLTAIMFLYVAIKSYCRKKWFFVVFFSILSVITHFSVLMYLAVLVSAFLLRKIHINKDVVIILIILSFLGGVFFPAYMQNLFFDMIINQDIRYSNYSTQNDLGMFKGNLNYAAKLPTLLALSFSILLLYLNKKQDFVYWALFLLTIMLSVFVLSSWTLTNRCMMTLPIFWGMNVAMVYKYSDLKNREILKKFSYVGIVIIVISIYGLRNIYFPFI